MTADATRIRVATTGDAAGIMNIGRCLHAENGTGAFAEDRVKALIDRAVRGDNAICGIAGPPNEVHGAVLLTLSQFWYSDDWLVTEQLLCVLHEYRRSTHAKDLLAYAKHVANTLKLPLLCGLTTKTRLEAKSTFYRKSLGPMSGMHWIYEPNCEA